MMKKTHIITGVTFSSIIAAVIGISITPVFIIAAAVGAILPDLDHPSGALNQKILLVHNCFFKCITYLVLAGLIYFYGRNYVDSKLIIFMVVILVVIGFSRHRSVTHSLVAVTFMSTFLLGVKMIYKIDIVYPVTLGIVSHILVDMLNPQGVELLWPCKKNIGSPITVTTNGIGEKILFYTCIGFTILMGLKLFM